MGIPPSAQNIDVAWEQPRIRRVASWDERVDDLRAVLDDAGVDRAFLLGFSEGGPMAVTFAAMYPGRTLGLILWGTCGLHGAGGSIR